MNTVRDKLTLEILLTYLRRVWKNFLRLFRHIVTLPLFPSKLFIQQSGGKENPCLCLEGNNTVCNHLDFYQVCVSNLPEFLLFLDPNHSSCTQFSHHSSNSIFNPALQNLLLPSGFWCSVGTQCVQNRIKSELSYCSFGNTGL